MRATKIALAVVTVFSAAVLLWSLIGAEAGIEGAFLFVFVLLPYFLLLAVVTAYSIANAKGKKPAAAIGISLLILTFPLLMSYFGWAAIAIIVIIYIAIKRKRPADTFVLAMPIHMMILMLFNAFLLTFALL